VREKANSKLRGWRDIIQRKKRERIVKEERNESGRRVKRE
jgi:hypothetical protein